MAPARDLSCAIAAVDCGADAVYIGGPSFGARRAASNSMAEVEKLAAYARRFGARVYLALNTLLTDEELPLARALAVSAWEAGVDALIVQDMAFLEMDLPPIALHASTQCDNRTPEKVRFLEAAGFSRAVLARELTLDGIGAIRAAAGIELECFIHGALCVSVSGQCYLSAAMTGRSANRGECAQPCRLPCELRMGGKLLSSGKHLLSLKDLRSDRRLAGLLSAGVSSLKIEGRLKDEGYVRNVTAHYRRLLDRILEGRPDLSSASSGRVALRFSPDPAKSFNRGFTDFPPPPGALDYVSFDTPKHVGERVGVVERVERGRLLCRLCAEVVNGDGLAWFDEGGALRGLRVNRAEGSQLHPAQGEGSPQPGATLFRNVDTGFEKTLSGGAERRIPVTARLSEARGGFELTYSDGEGNVGAARIESVPENAREPEGATEAVRASLSRLGGTIFTAEGVETEWPAPRFVPPKLLNGARRAAVEALEAARLAALARPLRLPEESPPAPFPSRELTYLGNVANRLARKFYERHGVRTVAPAFETARPEGSADLMTSIHCLKRHFGLCPKEGGRADGPLTLTIGNRSFDLDFDCASCLMKVKG